MFQSLFTRLLAIFMAVIIGVVFIGAAFALVTIRTNSVNSRMENLLVAAREIAFLASRMEDQADAVNHIGGETPTMSYLQHKADSVFKEYGAYILILDRNGRVMDNMMTAMKNNPDTLQSLVSSDVTEALREVLTGQEVQARITNALQGAIFTVAVPWVQDDAVLGAVFIHTSAQQIEAQYRGLVPQLLFGFSLAFLLAILCVVVYTRAVVKPLKVITTAAEDMSRGNFNRRAEVTGVDEVRQLAGAFNVMAEELGQVEENRREFVANVSHELRSPVTSIHGFVESMLDGTVPPNEYEQYLRIVKDETDRLKNLIADLLQLSRIDKGGETLKLTDYDLNEAIRRVVIARMAEIEQKQLDVHLEFQSDVCMVRADQDRIAQVIYNLVDNAVKFAWENASLTIHTTLVHDKVSMIVENEGIPISEKDRAHIFERFYKADKAHTSGKGTGLGLSICQKIMEMHGQTIRALPRETGAAFEITLPAGEKPVRVGHFEGEPSLEDEAEEEQR